MLDQKSVARPYSGIHLRAALAERNVSGSIEITATMRNQTVYFESRKLRAISQAYRVDMTAHR